MKTLAILFIALTFASCTSETVSTQEKTITTESIQDTVKVPEKRSDSEYFGIDKDDHGTPSIIIVDGDTIHTDCTCTNHHE